MTTLFIIGLIIWNLDQGDDIKKLKNEIRALKRKVK